jgi:hypothetical protein
MKLLSRQFPSMTPMSLLTGFKKSTKITELGTSFIQDSEKSLTEKLDSLAESPQLQLLQVLSSSIKLKKLNLWTTFSH